MAQGGQRLDASAFTASVFGVVILHKLASFLTPYQLYFSFSSFLYNQTGILRWQALLVKLALPTLFAFVFYVAAFRFLLMVRSYGRSSEGPEAFLRQAAEPSLKMGALFAAILLAWPFLVYWDLLIEPTLRDRRLVFTAAYLMYFAAYYFFAGFGVQLAKAYLSRAHKSDPLLQTGVGDFSWLGPVRDGVAGVVTSLVATGLTAMAGFNPS
jgi:hypothetical protein